MRNAVEINDCIITIDNSGCIGSKELDAVQVPDDITAYFTARTAILEQLCAGAVPIQLLMANFSGVICSAFRNTPRVARECSGMPFKYLFVSSPCANGEKAMNPEPS